MTDWFVLDHAALAAFGQVIMIDLVLAGDNAVVIGLAAAGLPPERRKRAILVGIVAATVLRIVFAGVALELLQIVGLVIPLLAIFAQLNESITLPEMLKFLVAAICLFSIGHLLQRFSSGGRSE